MKRLFYKTYWLLASQFGLDPLRLLRGFRRLPAFFLDLSRFRSCYVGRLELKPCLHDRFEEGGITKGEYFWQDLVVARMVFAASPERHVDVGSRVDGFVAHVASFRELEVFDIRPVSTNIPGVVFRQVDVMQHDSLPRAEGGYCDSLSCLHAIEHFGLGRYGDRVDQDGYKRGIEAMTGLLADGGMFYLATPIGRERVEFNANWVFDPRRIIRFVEGRGLQLVRFLTVEFGEVHELEICEPEMNRLAAVDYSLGIFVFRKGEP